MVWASPTEIEVNSGIGSFIAWISEVTNFWFGRMFILAIFFIFLFGYMRAKDDDFFGGLAVASYICFVIGLLAWVIGMITGYDFAVIIAITLVSSILLLVQRGSQ